MAETSNNFLPYYFFIGEDALKRAAVADKLKSRIAALGDLDFNFAEFDGGKDGAAAIIGACETLPLLSPFRYVLVKNVEKIPSAQGKLLAAYLEHPTETTILAISGSGLDVKTALGKAMASAPGKAVVDCSLGDIRNLVKAMAKSHGSAMADDAVAVLIQLVGSDTVRLDSEISKLSLAHVGNGPIQAEEVRSSTAATVSTEFKPWEFLDAMCAGDAALCFRIVSSIDDDEFLRLHTLCIGRIKELIAAKSRTCGSAASLGAALGKKDWQVKNHLRWASRFDAQVLEFALANGVETEAAMKSGADVRQAFTAWLCDLFAGRKN